MKRVAIFGNAGGGKSTLAKMLVEITGLLLHPIDSIKYKPGGEEIPHAEYLKIHAELLQNERWIIDGFGCVESAWERSLPPIRWSMSISHSFSTISG